MTGKKFGAPMKTPNEKCAGGFMYTISVSADSFKCGCTVCQ
jgi:hypothetical protein